MAKLYASEAAGRVGQAHRVLHLAQNLRFAEHHRIEPGGDAEGVAHGVVLRQRVQERAQVGILQLVVVGQEMRGAVDGVVDVAAGPATMGRIQLGAVAGRQQCRFAGNGVCVVAGEPDARRGDRAADFIDRKHHFFAQGQRRVFMVESDGEQLHLNWGK